MAISIREAVPGDVEDVARISDLSGRQQIVLDSFKGEQKVPCWAFTFPGPEEERLEKIGWLFLNAESLGMHYSRYKVAEIDGRIAGGLCTFTKDQESATLYVKNFREMGYSYLDILAGFYRGQAYFRAHPPTLKNALVVDYVATFPEYQRRGVITALLEDAIANARTEGFPRMQVTTFIGNISSQGAYEKVGFRVDKEGTNRSHEKLYGSPGMMRLVLDL
jgi:GNAT superfamily N-acetyltransferase